MLIFIAVIVDSFASVKQRKIERPSRGFVSVAINPIIPHLTLSVIALFFWRGPIVNRDMLALNKVQGAESKTYALSYKHEPYAFISK